MQAVLRERGLLTAGVAAELAAGRQYWREEARLCGLMLRRPAIPPEGHGAACGFSLEEALAASAAKSFDYRLLNQLVYALRGAPPDAALLEFLRVDELLVDIGGWEGAACGGRARWLALQAAGRPGTCTVEGACHATPLLPHPPAPPPQPAGDDLLDYEDDVTAGPSAGGSFNVLRCYAHLHGRAAPLELVRRIGELEAARDALLAALPPEQQRHVKQRQVDAAEEGAGALRWQIPQVILDEAAFREQFA